MGSGNLVRLTMTKLSKPNYYYYDDGNDDKHLWGKFSRFSDGWIRLDVNEASFFKMSLIFISYEWRNNELKYA